MDLEETVQAQVIDPKTRRPSARGQTGFWVTLSISIFVHVALGAAAIYASPKERYIDLNKAIPVQLVKLGKKRDPKLLPRLVAAPPPPKDEGVALDDKDTPKPKTKPEKKPKPDKLSDAASRLLSDRKMADALRKLDEEAEGDPDGSEFGTTTDATNAAAGYAAKIAGVLQSNYRLPEAIPASQRNFLRASVLLFIEPDGRISKYEFVNAHPNKLFMGALESLLKKVKLPPPPKSEAKRFQSDGVELVFRP